MALENKEISWTLSAIDNASRVFSSTESSLARLHGAFTKLAGVLGIGLSVGYFVSLIKGSIDAMDHLEDLRKSTDLTVTELAGLSLLARQSGTDLDGLANAIVRMSVAMGKDPEKFRALGVSAKDNLGAFKQVSDIFKSLTDVQQRNALAQAIFSKSWAEVAPVLSLGSEKIGEIVERVARLAPNLAENARRANEFKSNLAELNATMEGSKNRIVGDMLPALNAMTKEVQFAYETEGKLAAVRAAAGGLGAFLFTDDFSSNAVKLKNLETNLNNLTAARGRFFSGFSSAELEEKISTITAKIEALKQTMTPPQKSVGDRIAELTAIILKAGANADAARKAKDFLEGQNEAERLAVRLQEQLKMRGRINELGHANIKAQDDAYRTAGIMSEEQYYARRRQIGDEALKDLEKLSDQEGIAISQRARADDTPGGRLRADKETIALTESIQKAQLNAASQGVILDLQQTQARKALNDEVRQTLASTLELGGDQVSASYLRLSAQYEALILQANRLSGAEKQNAVEIADNFLSSSQAAIGLNQTLRETEQQYAAVGAAISLVNARIDARKTSGVLSDIGGMLEQGKANAEAAQAMAELRDRTLAAAEAFDELNNKPAALAERLKAAGIEAEMVRLSASIDLVGNAFRKNLEDPAVSALDAITDGTKSVSTAFRDMVRDIQKNINHMVNKNLMQMLFGTNQAQSFTGGWASMLFGAPSGGSPPSWLSALMGIGGGGTGGMAAAAGNSGWMEGLLLGSFAEGTKSVPRTGPYLLHQGERVTKASDKSAGATVNISINLSGNVDKRSASQIAVAAGEGVQRALARNT